MSNMHVPPQIMPSIVNPACADTQLSRQQVFAALKDRVVDTESGGHNQYVSCDVPELDRSLGGGVRCGHVHLLTGQYDDAAATGFGLALLCKMMAADTQSAVIWCAPSYSGYQGRICCEGLAAQGINPGRIIFVHEQNANYLMSACEEALRTDSVLAVVGEYGVLYRKADIWQRRLLRARRAARSSGATGIFIGADAPCSGAETGWFIRSQPDYTSDLDWRPVWDVTLRYARHGRPCKMRLRWDQASRQFRSESALNISNSSQLAAVSDVTIYQTSQSLTA